MGDKSLSSVFVIPGDAVNEQGQTFKEFLDESDTDPIPWHSQEEEELDT